MSKDKTKEAAGFSGEDMAPAERALTVIESKFPILNAGDNAGEVMQANLGDADLSALDLPTIKVPSAGGQSFTVPTLAGDENIDAIVGIIVHFSDVRSFWPEGLGNDQPPACSSDDCRVGVGDPGGSCVQCPYAQFGSAKAGTAKGQACKHSKRLFVLRPGERLPTLVPLPPTSLKAVRAYFVKLTAAGHPYWSIVTEIGLDKGRNAAGQDYSKAVFKASVIDGKLATLSPVEAARAKELGDSIKAILGRRPAAPPEGAVVD